MPLLYEECSSPKREKMQVSVGSFSALLLENFLVRTESAKEMQVVYSPCELTAETLTVIHLSG